jgi:hypothetical protein
MQNRKQPNKRARSPRERKKYRRLNNGAYNAISSSKNSYYYKKFSR